ncbi:MAG: hypothetical protein ACRELA_10275, partial [Candidatus Rokuibacteriota bacterium]
STVADQIDLPPALLSRFDVIFALTDKPDPERDRVLASHILDVHHAGAIAAYLEHHPEGVYTEEDAQEATARIRPPIERDFLRKYIAYAKRTCYPVLTPEAQQRLQDYYVNIRRAAAGEGSGPVPMTARQLEALVRLSEASARVRLSNEVGVDDANRAIAIVEYWLNKVARADGVLDIDIVASGTSTSQRERIAAVLKHIRELAAGDAEGLGAAYDDVVARAAADRIEEAKVRETIERLKQQGRIYEKRANRFKLTQE